TSLYVPVVGYEPSMSADNRPESLSAGLSAITLPSASNRYSRGLTTHFGIPRQSQRAFVSIRKGSPSVPCKVTISKKSCVPSCVAFGDFLGDILIVSALPFSSCPIG